MKWFLIMWIGFQPVVWSSGPIGPMPDEAECLKIARAIERASSTVETSNSAVHAGCNNGEFFRKELFSSQTEHAQMISRAYTVQEIDSLREAVKNKYIFGAYDRRLARDMGRGYNEVAMSKAVEDQVRTWMLAGKTSEDLMNSEK